MFKTPRRRRPMAAKSGGAFLVVLVVVLIQQFVLQKKATTAGPTSTTPAPSSSTGGVSVASVYAAKQSDAWVNTEGRVERLMPDDRETRDGSDMHQRFLVRTDDGVTVLVAHNIDAAGRVPAKVGDRVALRGEYEWSEKGGTIHFTHAPKYATKDQNKGGWIEHDGKRYE